MIALSSEVAMRLAPWVLVVMVLALLLLMFAVVLACAAARGDEVLSEMDARERTRPVGGVSLCVEPLPARECRDARRPA